MPAPAEITTSDSSNAVQQRFPSILTVVQLAELVVGRHLAARREAADDLRDHLREHAVAAAAPKG